MSEDDPLKTTPAVELDRDNAAIDQQEHRSDVDDLLVEIERLQHELAAKKKSFEVACFNVEQLNAYSQNLADTLTKALNLVENLMGEMRVAGVVPSALCTFAKASLDQAMRKLSGMGEKTS